MKSKKSLHRFSFFVLRSSFLAFLALAGCDAHHAGASAEWTCMGTNAKLLCRNAADIEVADRVKKLFADIETLLSAHNSESELARLAKLTDAEVLENCDSLVRPCYEAAFRYREMTGGVFNPRWRGAGTMDLGAIAKGFAVDLACELVGDREVLIDLGGNMKSCGGTWRVGIYGSDRILSLGKGEACATSGEYFRGAHIKDGRDGSEVKKGGFSVTVVHCTSAMAAYALSTVLWITKERDAAKYDAGAKEAIWQE
ncbi:MAG: FAD:protein FMN transferase [Kiritimatiellae bacterium]|nr:FAD:protein FMN transferase [Kiritimatiellia bacterium]